MSHIFDQVHRAQHIRCDHAGCLKIITRSGLTERTARRDCTVAAKQAGWQVSTYRVPNIDFCPRHKAQGDHATSIRLKPMTNRERDAVVELLRCAADIGCLLEAGYTTGYRGRNGYPCTEIYDLAVKAYVAVPDVPGGYYMYPEYLLEAAQRVEEGWNP